MPRRGLVGLGVLGITAFFSLACEVEEDPVVAPEGGIADREEVRGLLDEYLETYLQTFPTRATATGDHRGDRHLEDLSAQRLETWLETNRKIRDRLEGFLEDTPSDLDLRLDAQAVHRHAAWTVFELETLDAPRRNPLFWARILGRVSIFLLVRDDLPLEERLEALVERVSQVPRLCAQATSLLAEGRSEQISAARASLAARQIAAAAELYDSGLARVAESLDGERADVIRARLREVAAPAARAHRELAATLEGLASRATGDPRLGDLFAESFRLGTGLDESLAEVLARAEKDLVATRTRTADYCRSIWPEIDDGEPPGDEREAIRACFRRIARDHAGGRRPFVEHYQRLAREAHEFVVEHQILTPPGPLTLRVDAAPAFLAGQAVGGIYPSGPFAPEADALLFVPSIPDEASAEEKQAFYGDFNDHFNVMITPHETTPGHYAQSKWAAKGGSKIRAIFADGVYLEGWGTFSERLMLDHGWGTPLSRVAHLKKQLENIARTIVDIRVNSQGMERDDMLHFLRDEAMQDGQFAINMWGRAITTSPQLTTYYLGYRDIAELYETWRADHPDAPAKEFSDRMVSLGPVAVENYRSLFHAASSSR